MTVREAVALRRATTHFDPHASVPRDELTKLMRLACQAPSAMNLQPWRFLIVDTAEMKARLQPLCFMQAQVSDASALVIVLGDLNHHRAASAVARDHVERGAYDEERAERYRMEADLFYENEPQRRRDEMFRGCSLWAMTFMLLATEAGYDTAPMAGFDPEGILTEFRLPPNLLPVIMVAVGRCRADAPTFRRAARLPIEELIVDAL